MFLQEKVVINKENPFDSWNALQPHYLGNLGRFLGEIFSTRALLSKLKLIDHQPTRQALTVVHDLYCVSRIINDIGVFRENDFISSDQFKLLRDRATQLCAELTSHAIKLTDVIGPEEFLLQSELARGDGNVMHNFLDKVYQAKNCFEPASWGSELTRKDSPKDEKTEFEPLRI